MSNPKYQIKIVKAGIGDPMVTIQFKFTNSDGSYTIPSSSAPLHNLVLTTELTWLNSSGESLSANTGNVSINKVQTSDAYNMTLPFDMPSGFEMSNDVSLAVFAEGENGAADISFVNGSGNSMAVGLTYFEEPADYAELYVSYEYTGS